ncbi:MAG TPA: hypothetical protein DCP90_04165 [Clostridiales bacterium]|nr:MAG: hypothetical protein A2Y22_07400 [Clostridiales bacterium GWD2_32_59]HAN09790.1 hypothetical protein [Clostridiales bacterium]
MGISNEKKLKLQINYRILKLMWHRLREDGKNENSQLFAFIGDKSKQTYDNITLNGKLSQSTLESIATEIHRKTDVDMDVFIGEKYLLLPSLTVD